MIEKKYVYIYIYIYEASYNKYLKKKKLIAECRLLITAREEFLVTASSKIQPRVGCKVSPIYRLPNTEFCVQYTTIVSSRDHIIPMQESA